MNYIELSLKNVKEESKKLYQKIQNDFDYDLVVFIARGAYPIGKHLAKLKDVPLIEIEASRKGNTIKKIIKPLFKFIPKKMLITLRKREMNSNYHQTNRDRVVYFDERQYHKYNSKINILLVDDSVDSGNTIKHTKKVLQYYFKNSKIKTAVFNVMNKSDANVDYYLYKDTMICGPWSNDSKENKKFSKLYNDWKLKR